MTIIFPDQLIDLGDGNLSDVLASNVQNFNFRKISLDISKIKDKQKVYESYTIPDIEKLIAFCKGTVFFIGIADSGVVFTDKAMYLHPDEETTQTRFLYTDFCKYIVVKQSDNDSEFRKKRAGLYIQNNTGEYLVYGGTIFLRNSAAEELFCLITTIQHELITQNPLAKEELDRTIISIFDSYEQEMRKGSYNEQRKMLLKQFLNNPDHCEQAFMLMAEDAYRENGFYDFSQYIDNMSSQVSDEILVKARDMEPTFAKHLISDLSNLQKEIYTAYINRLSKRLHQTCLPDITDADIDLVLKALVSLRISDYCMCAKCIEALKAKGRYVLAEVPEIVMFYSGAKKMQPILEKIISGIELDESELNIRDNVGFTPLHYAIIFAEKPYIYSILDQCEWYKDYNNMGETETQNMYRYSVIYYMRHGDVDDKVLGKTESALAEIKNDLENLQQEEYENHEQYKRLDAKLGKAYSNLHTAQRRCRSGDCTDEDATRWENVISDIEQSKRDIVDTQLQIAEKREEYEATYKKRQEELKKEIPICANLIPKNSNSFLLLLKSIVEMSSEELVLPLEHMQLGNDMKLYRFDETGALLPSSFNLKSVYRTVNITHEGEIINGSMDNGSLLVDDVEFV